LLIAALGLLFFAPLHVHPSWVLHSAFSDLLAYQVPQMRYLVSSWQQTGELPRWCPYSFAGMPFIHDLQVGAFYPPHVLLYVLPEEMVGPALSWLIVAHVIVAGWAMFAYARTQELDRTCALIAAIGYMFAGKWLLHILAAGQYVVVGLAWLPLVLLLLERGVGRGSFLAATWAGVALALLMLGSHPQLAFYAALLIALWTLPPALERTGALNPGGRSWRAIASALGRWSGVLAWCGFVALGLVAVQLLPTLEAAAQTTRRSAGIQFNVLAEVLLATWGLVGPAPEGLPPTMGWEYRTGWTVLWAATALMAPVLFRGRPRRQLQAAICLALVVFGLGGAAVFQDLPGFRLFRLPSRMFLITALPIALLVGAVTQLLFEALRSDAGLRRSLGRGVILLILLGLFSTASLYWIRGRWLGAPVVVYWGSLLVTLPSAGWVVMRITRAADRPGWWTARRFQLAWGLLLTVDLWAMTWSMVSVRPQAPIYAPSACVQLVLDRRRDHERVLDREVEGEWERTPFAFALPILNRVDPIRGYNPLDIRRYKEFVQFISDRDEAVSPANGIGNFPIVNKALLDLLGTRYLLQPSGLRPMDGEPGDIAHDPRWWKIGEDPAPETHLFVAGDLQRLPPYTVYENRDAFPRAFVVPRAEPLPARDRILETFKTADLHRVVFLEDGPVPAAGTRSSGEFRPAKIVTYNPDEITIEVDCTAPGYLVLTDPWYPGWTGTVDGRSTPIYRADYVFRAVAVPAGKHEVRFRFEPASLRRGQAVTAASLVGVLGLSVTTLARRFRGRGPKSAPADPPRPDQASDEVAG
jgi:hypothetical protein